MTRGKIAVVLKEKTLVSVEFNGDMYVENGHGTQVLDELKNINTEQEYRDFVQAFDSENFNYATESKRNGENYFDNKWYTNGVREVVGEEENQLCDFCNNYFDKWFSDYVYLKNIHDDYVDIVCTIEEDGKEFNDVPVRIEPNGVVVLNFGTLVEKYSTGYEVLSRIEEIKENEEFDGCWYLATDGVIIKNTSSGKEYYITEVDECTQDHIIEEIRQGYVNGAIYNAYAPDFETD
ncbi:MAG: hypothetical protein J6J36_06750 [Clostridia bacterium]|nr:hypothetical protein [Clostridia bacterium]